MISGSMLAVSGLSSAGLSTTVQPEARHGASFQVASMNGTFHGVMRPATPFGRLIEYPIWAVLRNASSWIEPQISAK